MPGMVYQQGPPPSERTWADGVGTAALVLGLLGIVTCGLTSVFAIVLGHLAYGKKLDGPTGRGDGRAIAGIVLGWLLGLGWLAAWLLLLANGDRIAEYVDNR